MQKKGGRIKTTGGSIRRGGGGVERGGDLYGRPEGELGLGIVRSPILMLWGPLWSPAAGSRIITHQQTSARERATIKPLPLYLLYQRAARGPLA
ncbi:MAG: hypothetical protein E6J04_20910 [Chloroflexi bacterium]|nr:MAG: hypothetical protein E6J04_20910 [Chloroflexota bacterium]